MTMHYTPLTQFDLEAIGVLGHFSPPGWTGPALPRPDSEDAFRELLAAAAGLVARGQYLIQAKDGLSTTYTLNGVTATAERFMLGTEEQVEKAADLRLVVVLLQQLLEKLGVSTEAKEMLGAHLSALRGRMDAWFASRLAAAEQMAGARAAAVAVAAPAPAAEGAQAALPPDPNADYSAWALEDPAQYAMVWTTFEDAYRHGFPHLPEYVAPITDPDAATRQFWPTLRSSALPYNLLVLQKLNAANVTSYINNFGAGWTPAYDQLLAQGRLYGIDMTIFDNLAPSTEANGTTRFTPSTMVLLEMNDAKEIDPIAVFVADPQDVNNAQVYTPGQPAWIYALLAARTSLTVHGIWLGHVYTLHIVTAAMQMAMWNTLPPRHVVHQLLAPHSHYLIPFDLILMLGWGGLAPPTSISDAGKFLTLCNRYSATHDFFSTDPPNTLAALGLDPADFTDPSVDGGKPWNLYPNVQVTLEVWEATAGYVGAVVDAAYPTDQSVADDAALAAWIQAASSGDGGNVAGLARLETREALKRVLTSLLFRIVFHGMGRLRSMAIPLLSFAPNYPPCLQSGDIPAPDTALTTADLLRTYLPRTGTLGQLLTFYDVFAFSAPYVPMVPDRGPTHDLFFDPDRFPGANDALVGFREQVEQIIRTLQPEWVQIGQWPRNIEL